MSISVLAGIREYLSGCPLFDNGLIRVNYLEGEPIAYTVDEVPAEPVVRQYTDGRQNLSSHQASITAGMKSKTSR